MVLVIVIDRPGLLIEPVVILWLANKLIVALPAPLILNPVVLIFPVLAGDRSVTGLLKIILLFKLMLPLLSALPMVIELKPEVIFPISGVFKNVVLADPVPPRVILLFGFKGCIVKLPLLVTEGVPVEAKSIKSAVRVISPVPVLIVFPTIRPLVVLFPVRVILPVLDVILPIIFMPLPLILFPIKLILPLSEAIELLPKIPVPLWLIPVKVILPLVDVIGLIKEIALPLPVLLPVIAIDPFPELIELLIPIPETLLLLLFPIKVIFPPDDIKGEPILIPLALEPFPVIVILPPPEFIVPLPTPIPVLPVPFKVILPPPDVILPNPTMPVSLLLFPVILIFPPAEIILPLL